MPNTPAIERRTVKGFSSPRGGPEELRRTWNRGKDSPVREEPKGGKSEIGGTTEEGIAEGEATGVVRIGVERETSVREGAAGGPEVSAPPRPRDAPKEEDEGGPHVGPPSGVEGPRRPPTSTVGPEDTPEPPERPEIPSTIGTDEADGNLDEEGTRLAFPPLSFLAETAPLPGSAALLTAVEGGIPRDEAPRRGAPTPVGWPWEAFEISVFFLTFPFIFFYSIIVTFTQHTP